MNPVRVTYCAIATTIEASNPTITLEEVVSAEFGEGVGISQVVASQAIVNMVSIFSVVIFLLFIHVPSLLVVGSVNGLGVVQPLLEYERQV